MRAPPVIGNFPPCFTIRAGILVIAVVSRIVCLFLVSQWPHYFHTYHTSSELLHLDVPPLQDGASWRTATGNEGADRPPWNPPQGVAAGRGHRLCKWICQELPPDTKTAFSSEEHFRQSTEQSTSALAGENRTVTLLPVLVPVRVNGMQMLASAPLHDMHVQTLLAASHKQNFFSLSLPVTTWRPQPFSVTLDRCCEGQKVGCRAETSALSRLSGVRPTQAEKQNTDRWLWHLLVPLLSWDAEYFVACAMQRTRYFFEMTHAFFPGLSLIYVALKEFIWPTSKNMFSPSSPVDFRDSTLMREGRSIFHAFFLSDATCYGLIGVILSNVSFILATLGVFEVALLLDSSRRNRPREAATAHNNTGLSEIQGRTHCASRDQPASVAAQRVVRAAWQRQMSSSPSSRPETTTLFQKFGGTLEKWGGALRSPKTSIQPDERQTQTACSELSQNQVGGKSLACWAAFWYAFSGASVHMSAAYTESFFACLSIWGLVLLLRAEEFVDQVEERKSSQLGTAKCWMEESVVHLSTEKIYTQYGSRHSRMTTLRGEALPLGDVSTRSLLPEGREGTSHTLRTGVAIRTRRYCFSWAATILFCSAALLRSNGSLSLIPLFFHTLRTCPAVCRMQALFTSGAFDKRRGVDGDVCVVSTVHGRSSALKSRLFVDVVKLPVAVLAHWVNALLQAMVVLLASFLVLSYPYYLYCACPQTLIPAHLDSGARSEIWTIEDRHCQVISRFLGQRSALQPSPASEAPSTSAHTPEFVDTDNSSVFPMSPSCAANSVPTQSIAGPPSFIAFAQSFLLDGLPYSLRILRSSIQALPIIGHRVRFAHNPHTSAVGSPKGGDSAQNTKFVGESTGTGSVQHVLHSEGSHRDAAYTRPAWCGNSIPNVYSSVQREYWGVEFLGFLRVETLYLIIMCVPFYAVSVLCVIHLLAPCRTSLEKSRGTAHHACLHPPQCQARRSAEEQRKRITCVKNKAISQCEELVLLLLKRETGHVVQLAVLSTVMLFFAHSNVFVRLSTACPVYFLHMARLHTAYTHAIKRANECRLSRRRVSASLAVDGVRRRESCGVSSAQEPMGTPSISDSDFRRCSPGQYLQMLGGNWWEWCSAFVLVHHFLGPLLFSCYITWT